MKINSILKKLLSKGKLLVFSTSSKKGKPNSIFVASHGLFNNKVLIADCEFSKTRKNLAENKFASLVVNDSKNYFQLKGIVQTFSKGKYFALANNSLKTMRGNAHKINQAIVFLIKEIYEL